MSHLINQGHSAALMPGVSPRLVATEGYQAGIVIRIIIFGGIVKVVIFGLFVILLVPAGSMSFFAKSSRQNSSQTKPKVYEPKEVDRKAKVTKRSEPQYTEQARRNHTSGLVVLRVVLKSTGEIGDITVIKDLPDDLTEECIRVAREIKFVLAVKNGNPVSQYLKIQYTFMVD